MPHEIPRKKIENHIQMDDVHMGCIVRTGVHWKWLSNETGAGLYFKG
jgi:hypothetical protein